MDGSCWANDRGYGRYTREMLTELVRIAPEDEFVFFLDPASRTRFSLRGPNVRVVEVSQSRAPSQAAAADGSRSIRDMLRFTRAVWRESPDVLLFPSVYTYFPSPLGQRTVVGIMDAIAERFASRTLPSARARFFWNAKVRLAVWQSTLVLTISEFAADDVSTVIGVPRSNIRIATAAVSSVFRPSSREEIVAAARQVGLPEGARWFAYVGGFSPHKNLDVLVRSFRDAVQDQASGAATYLLLVGKLQGDAFHSCVEEVRALVSSLGIEDRVVWTGFIPDEQMRHLYSGAVAAVLPSDCEGFGLPPAEAAACGTAVVATTQSPLPQLLRGGGIFVRPRDQTGLTAALGTLLADEDARAGMGRVGMERAADLTWERSASGALAALREAVRR